MPCAVRQVTADIARRDTECAADGTKDMGMVLTEPLPCSRASAPVVCTWVSPLVYSTSSAIGSMISCNASMRSRFTLGRPEAERQCDARIGSEHTVYGVSRR